MRLSRSPSLFASWPLVLILTACSTVAVRSGESFRSQLLAAVPNPPSGLVVTSGGVVLVALPRAPVVPRMFEETRGASLVAVGSDGALLDYPNSEWNRWDGASGESAAAHFVSLGGLALAGDTLWVVDSGRLAEGPVAGGAKLVAVDLAGDRVTRSIPLDGALAPDSDLAEVVVDARGTRAFVSDPGAEALVVVDLATGAARRVLEHDRATRAEPATAVSSLGLPAVRGDGRPLPSGVRTLALDDQGHLYFAPLAAHTLYRLDTAALADATLPAEDLARRVERAGEGLPFIGGLCFAKHTLLVADLQNGAIAALRPDGHLTALSASPELALASNLQLGRANHLYFAASPQRSASARLDRGLDPVGPAGVYISFAALE